jgi:hypothetical protein
MFHFELVDDSFSERHVGRSLNDLSSRGTGEEGGKKRRRREEGEEIDSRRPIEGSDLWRCVFIASPTAAAFSLCLHCLHECE